MKTLNMDLHEELCIWIKGNNGLDDLCPFNVFGWCHYHRKNVELHKGVCHKGLPTYKRCEECKDINERPQMNNDLPQVTGRRCECSINQLEDRLKYYIGEEQRTLHPDNGLIAALCDAVRQGREYGDVVQNSLIKKELLEALKSLFEEASKYMEFPDDCPPAKIIKKYEVLYGGKEN